MSQLQEKYGAKKRKVRHVFVYLEKAFDKVLREVTVWAQTEGKVGGIR